MATTPSKPPRVRFAPSPTGKLHVGGARTAIFNWAFARATGGAFILRIEDTDPERSTEENEQVILRAMRWLGLDWDEGPEVGGEFGPYRQSERFARYDALVERLLAEGKAYYCFCSPEKLEADREAARTRKDPFQGYPRTCRSIDPAEAKARAEAGEPCIVRLKVPLDRGDVHVHDLIHGDVTFNAKELDDFVIRRTDGTPTYNFCVVADDAAMEITHVVRGDDHLSNTPRQVLVYEALGLEPPLFAHVPMICGPDGKKLSKRHGATSVEEWRDEGYDPEAFVNYLALLGWSLDGETTVVPREVLCREFSLERISKNPAVFDPKKLLWLNAEYLQAKTDEEFAREVLEPELVAAGLVEEGAASADPEWFALLAQILKPRAKLAPDVVGLSRFLFGDEVAIDEKARAKALEKEGAKAALTAAKAALIELDSFTGDEIDVALEPLPEELGQSKRNFYQAIRAAETGSLASPPLGPSLELLGKERALKRLDAAMELAR